MTRGFFFFQSTIVLGSRRSAGRNLIYLSVRVDQNNCFILFFRIVLSTNHYEHSLLKLLLSISTSFKGLGRVAAFKNLHNKIS